MRSSYGPRGRLPLGALPLARTPSHRQQATRRRWMVVGGMLALALASGAVGSFTAAGGGRDGIRETGPFSYFPYQ